MWKLALAATLLLIAPVMVKAQDYYGGNTAPEQGPRGGQLLNKDYLTTTGETVPRPGVPQSGVREDGFDPSTIRKHAQRLDSHIEHDICSNC